MTRTGKLVAVGGALAVAIAAVGYWRVSPRQPSDRGRRAGRALAAGVDRALIAAAAMTAPFRCADLAAGQPAGVELTAGERRFTSTGHFLSASAGDDRLVVGFVADARGAEAETLAQLERIRAEFTAAGVELVVTLGGMGADRAALSAVLGRLSKAAPWLVVAIPGDRESIPEHRAAIAALNADGAALVDGAELRIIEVDGVIIGTFPGVDTREHLGSGSAGCQHSSADANALAALLATRKAPRLWAGYAPPRQRHGAASDLTGDGIHVGERSLSAAVARAGVALVVHGMVDDSQLERLRATIAVDETTHFVAAGAIEAMPLADPRHAQVTGSALLVTITPAQIKWRRILLATPTGK